MKPAISVLIPILLSLGCAPITENSASAIGGSLPRKDTVFLRIDDLKPINGSENLILVCIDGGNFCKSDCISTYFPEHERWSVFIDRFVYGGRSVAYALSYPKDDGQPPRMKYWVGDYRYDKGRVTGQPDFDFESPEFEGRAHFEMVRLEEGQPGNGGPRVYYEHRWYDDVRGPISTRKLESFNPPGMWTYSDKRVSAASITPQLVAGATCIKESELENFVKSAFQ